MVVRECIQTCHSQLRRVVVHSGSPIECMSTRPAPSQLSGERIDLVSLVEARSEQRLRDGHAPQWAADLWLGSSGMSQSGLIATDLEPSCRPVGERPAEQQPSAPRPGLAKRIWRVVSRQLFSRADRVPARNNPKCRIAADRESCTRERNRLRAGVHSPPAGVARCMREGFQKSERSARSAAPAVMTQRPFPT